jgi:hypothetical protein
MTTKDKDQYVTNVLEAQRRISETLKNNAGLLEGQRRISEMLTNHAALIEKDVQELLIAQVDEITKQKAQEQPVLSRKIYLLHWSLAHSNSTSNIEYFSSEEMANKRKETLQANAKSLRQTVFANITSITLDEHC